MSNKARKDILEDVIPGQERGYHTAFREVHAVLNSQTPVLLHATVGERTTYTDEKITYYEVNLLDEPGGLNKATLTLEDFRNTQENIRYRLTISGRNGIIVYDLYVNNDDNVKKFQLTPTTAESAGQWKGQNYWLREDKAKYVSSAVQLLEDVMSLFAQLSPYVIAQSETASLVTSIKALVKETNIAHVMQHLEELRDSLEDKRREIQQKAEQITRFILNNHPDVTRYLDYIFAGDTKGEGRRKLQELVYHWLLYNIPLEELPKLLEGNEISFETQYGDIEIKYKGTNLESELELHNRKKANHIASSKTNNPAEGEQLISYININEPNRRLVLIANGVPIDLRLPPRHQTERVTK